LCGKALTCKSNTKLRKLGLEDLSEQKARMFCVIGHIPESVGDFLSLFEVAEN
jgi:hypothetical protein